MSLLNFHFEGQKEGMRLKYVIQQNCENCTKKSDKKSSNKNFSKKLFGGDGISLNTCQDATYFKLEC